MAYWIQIEVKPEGQNTGFIQMDLEKIIGVQVARENATPVGATLWYNEYALIRFELIKESLDQFMTAWTEFQSKKDLQLQYVGDEMTPSIIHIAPRQGNKPGAYPSI